MTALQDAPATAVNLEGTAPGDRFWTRRDTLIVALMMSLMLLRGIIIGSLTWPWYAPDEPDHAELALLTRQHGPAVSRDHLDPGIRLAIARSQYEWHVTERPPRDDDPSPGTWYGQVGRQPALYYLLAGWAAAWAAPGDIVGQLNGMRFMSALIGAAVVAGAYVCGRLMAPTNPMIAFGIGGVVLFQTGLGLLAGAVTNDILAAATVTWTLAACIAVLVGPRLPSRLLIGAGAIAVALVAALASKRTTVAVVLPVALVAIFVAAPMFARYLRSPRILAAVAGLILVGAIGLVGASVAFEEHRAVAWKGDQATRVRSGGPNLGQHAMQLGGSGRNATLSQALASPVVTGLRGQPATVGIWHRLADPADAPRPLTLRLDQRVSGETRPTSVTVTAGPDWRFSTLPVALHSAASSASLTISAPAAPDSSILVDGVILADGSHAATAVPTGNGRVVGWGDGTAANLLANGSFEDRPLGPQPWLRQTVERLTNRPFDVLVASVDRALDAPTSWDDLRYKVVGPLLETLWGRPGRTAELNLPSWWYRAQAIVAGAALIGLIVGGALAIRAGRLTTRHWQIVALHVTALAGTAAIALGPYLLRIYTGSPFGRYLLPAIVVIAAGYVAGLAWVWPRRWVAPAVLILVVLLAVLDTYTLLVFLPNHFAIRPPAPG